VLVQTQFPEHPLYQALVRQDYRSFAEELLDERRRAVFSTLCVPGAPARRIPERINADGFFGLCREPRGSGARYVTLYDPVRQPFRK